MAKKLRVWNIMIGHDHWQYGWVSEPNSAGGVSVRFTFRNTGDKIIKYAAFVFSFVNRVGDAVGRDSVRFTGPLKPGQTQNDALWKDAIYDNTVSGIVLDGVAVEYMDGTQEEVYPDEIDFSKPWF